MANKKYFFIDEQNPINNMVNPIKEIKEKNIFGWEIGPLRILTKSRSKKLRKIIYSEVISKIKCERKHKFKKKINKI